MGQNHQDDGLIESKHAAIHDAEAHKLGAEAENSTTVSRFPGGLLSCPQNEPVCYHGGGSWDKSGFDFEVRDSLVVGDVLDSAFPPCPEALQVLRDQLERCCRESPPTHCDELVETIATTRGIPTNSICVSSGSSSLMFSFLPRLLNEQSSVLILSPMYGEYMHILQHVVQCRVSFLTLRQEDGFIIDTDELVTQAAQHDAVILVNPNSPTGVYCNGLEAAVTQILSQGCKLVWVDETYIDYVSEAVSLEALAATEPNLIVCKSMSKCYALSGLRVAYTVSNNACELRRFIPPWSVSLPAQLAAVAALRNPEYYQIQYKLIHQQRGLLQAQLEECGLLVCPGVANFLLCFLPAQSSLCSSDFVEECKKLGVYVRDARNMGTGLGRKAVRFAVRFGEENERLVQCVKKVLASRDSDHDSAQAK